MRERERERERERGRYWEKYKERKCVERKKKEEIGYEKITYY
jgi:hypothetical protein